MARSLLFTWAWAALAFPAASAQTSRPESILELLREVDARSQVQDWAGTCALLERVVALNPHRADVWLRLGRARSLAQDQRGAITALERAQELGAGTQFSSVAYEIARAYGQLREEEPALAWLGRALDGGFRGRSSIAGDEAFAFLREDERFAALTLAADTAGMSRTEGWLHDLSFLELEVERMHYDPFRKISQADFETEARRLREDVASLTDDQIVVGTMALMSKLGDGHTGCYPEGVPAWERTLPVRFELFQEGLFVISAEPGSAELVGAQVVNVGEHAWEAVIEALGRIVSKDNTQGILRSGPRYLRFPQILAGLGLQAESDRVRLTIRDARGEQRSVTVTAKPTDPAFNRITGHPDWPTVLDASPGPLPLYLKDRRTPYWFELMEAEKTVYFQFNLVADAPGEPFARFVARLFEFVDEHEAERLVIDLRWNNGGNTQLLPPLVRALSRERTATRRGHLFVIVGRYTYSAAMNAATFLERHTDAIFVGEPTPSSPNFVGESNMVSLPWSRINVSISDLYWQSSWPIDRRTWIAPLIHVPPTLEAYAAKRDPALEAILAVPADD